MILDNILNIFKNKVAPRYRNHELSFDLESYHGRFHILRCLILADSIYCYYSYNHKKVDIERSLYAILFHDIMRQNNGTDIWESESAHECFTFLKNIGLSDDYASQTSELILKNNSNSIEEQILYDVDVLDYQRFFYLPDDRHLFEDYRLKFAGSNDIFGIDDLKARTKIIRLSEKLVIFTSTIPVSISTDDLVSLVVDYYNNIKPWKLN